MDCGLYISRQLHIKGHFAFRESIWILLLSFSDPSVRWCSLWLVVFEGYCMMYVSTFEVLQRPLILKHCMQLPLVIFSNLSLVMHRLCVILLLICIILIWTVQAHPTSDIQYIQYSISHQWSPVTTALRMQHFAIYSFITARLSV